MPIQEPHFGQGIVTFGVDATLLDGDRLPLCILQVAKVSDDAIDDDAPRPAVVAAIRDLIVGRAGVRDHSALDELLDGGVPTVILGPEYALGSGDWREVDEFVRSADRRLLLIVGFGMTRAAWLREWVGQAGSTQCWPGWDGRRERMVGASRYNGLWCWVHDPDRGTHCVTALKNFPEQRNEAPVPGFQAGRSIVRLRFRDFDVFPLICADLLQDARAGASTPRSRIADALRADGRDHVLVTGSLLQDRPWDENWQNPIAGCMDLAPPGKVTILALANQAHPQPSRDEERDKWRSLSGVFASRTIFHKGATPFAGGRAVKVGGSSVGLVVRHDGPCVVAGPVLVAPAPNPTVGLHLWQVHRCLPLGTDGIGPALAHADRVLAYEFHRLTLRHTGERAWNPRLSQGLALVRTHVEGARCPLVEDVVRSLLSGTERSARPCDGDDLHAAMPTLEEALHALASLSALADLTWHDDSSADGQLLYEPSGAHVLVWRDLVRTGSAMVRTLQEWTMSGEPHPHLLVIGSGRGGSRLPAGPVVPDRRSDWTSPPPESGDVLAPVDPTSDGAKDVTAPRARRSVRCIDLGDLCEALYLEYEADLDEERTTELLATLAAALAPRVA